MGFFNAIRDVVNNVEQLVDDVTQARNNRNNRNNSNISVQPARVAPTVSDPINQQPRPTSGLSLVKGQRITLEKNSVGLSHVCVGVNWGMIDNRTAVDLDVSCITFKNGIRDELVYYGALSGTGINHSGDDLTGDNGGDDGLDNEIITIDLTRVKPEVDQIFIILNSYRGHKFDKIPYATIRLYEGTATRVDNVIATYDIANDSTFKNSVSMIMGNLYRKGGEWRFHANGDTTSDTKIPGIVQTIQTTYL